MLVTADDVDRVSLYLDVLLWKQGRKNMIKLIADMDGTFLNSQKRL